MQTISYVINDKRNKQKWVVLKFELGKMICREKIGRNDHINFEAFRYCPDGVLRPGRGVDPKWIYFEWWGRSVLDFDREFQNDVSLFKLFMTETLTCMSLLHEIGITHGNLSAKKIFYNKKHFKIGYFERGRFSTIGNYYFNGAYYMETPEYRGVNWPSPADWKTLDVWALGLTFLACYDPSINLSALYTVITDKKRFIRVKTRTIPDSSIKTTLRKMLDEDPNTRFTMDQALACLTHSQSVQLTVVANKLERTENTANKI